MESIVNHEGHEGMQIGKIVWGEGDKRLAETD